MIITQNNSDNSNDNNNNSNSNSNSTPRGPRGRPGARRPPPRQRRPPGTNELIVCLTVLAVNLSSSYMLLCLIASYPFNDVTLYVWLPVCLILAYLGGCLAEALHVSLLGGTQTGSYQTGSYQKGRVIPPTPKRLHF